MRADFLIDARRTQKIPLLITAATFCFLLILFWTATWDDSAITLGFSRNLVKYGDIVPSQYSDRVEGYSTFLWMAIHAVFFWAGLDESQVLLIAKLLSTLLVFTNLLLIDRIVTEKVKDPFYRLLILMLYAVNAVSVGAAVFGMETALYAALVLLAYYLYERRNRSLAHYVLFSLVASCLILIRHEGVIFLLPFVLVTFFENPKTFFKTPFLYFWGIVFVIYHLWHFQFFGELVTNPMLAKDHWPYHPVLTSAADVFSYYLLPFIGMAVHYCVALVLYLAYLLKFKGQSNPSDTDTSWRLSAWIVVAGLLIMVLAGNRWGAAQRLSYPSLPFLLLIVFRQLDGVPFLSLIRGSFLTGFLSIFGWIVSVTYVFLSFQGLEFKVTVDRVREVARLVSETQKFLGRDVITFASPDMGGLILFEGDGKRIIDLGLLCNKPLAKTGYTIVEQYVLLEERPEIIKAHDVWLAPLGQSRSLFELYIPVQVTTEESMQYLFIRNDLMEPVMGGNQLAIHTYSSDTEIDPTLDKVLLMFKTYVAVDLRYSE